MHCFLFVCLFVLLNWFVWTYIGICDLFRSLSELKSLDVSENRNVDLSILEAALAMGNKGRAVEILCHQTNIKLCEFKRKYAETTSETVNNSSSRHNYQNITFQTWIEQRLSFSILFCLNNKSIKENHLKITTTEMTSQLFLLIVFFFQIKN